MPLRVLLADDDRDIRAVARLSLKRAGFEVIAVASGEEVVSAAVTSAPAVVVLDWLLPGMDGLEAMAALRADARTAGIPVRKMTGRTHPSEVEQAMAHGAIGCLSKPFNVVTLGDEVGRLVASWHAQHRA